IVYCFASVGSFAVLASLSGEGQFADRLDNIAGIAKRYPIRSAAMAVFLFSLAGIPSLAGFWGKMTLFSSAVRLGLSDEPAGMRFWFLVLAVVGALNAAVAAGYYLRAIATMYFREPQPVSITKAVRTNSGFAAIAICALVVVAVGVFPADILVRANQADQALGGTTLTKNRLQDETTMNRDAASDNSPSHPPGLLAIVDHEE
ncbi:MAG: hypothetical protein KDA99_27555, partial [Planctomycetales bacterium]|nr:hypothetical protein [Planctomycetales bacterium]